MKEKDETNTDKKADDVSKSELSGLLADFIGELWTYQKLKELATGITGKVAGYVKSAE